MTESDVGFLDHLDERSDGIDVAFLEVALTNPNLRFGHVCLLVSRDPEIDASPFDSHAIFRALDSQSGDRSIVDPDFSGFVDGHLTLR